MQPARNATLSEQKLANEARASAGVARDALVLLKQALDESADSAGTRHVRLRAAMLDLMARRIIETNRDKVEAITKALLEWETIGREQLDDIMAGKVPRPPKDWTPRTPPPGSSGSGDSGGSPVADPAPTTA